MGPVVLNIFFADLDSGIEFTLSSFNSDTYLTGIVRMMKGRDVIQRDLDKTERWTRPNKQFNEHKCKVLHLDQYNLQHE